MSEVYGISVETVTEILNQVADKMESVCMSIEEMEKSLELEFTIKENCLELEKLLLEKYEDIVIEKENPRSHHREKLLPYSKRRKFVKKPYWNRIRSRCY